MYLYGASGHSKVILDILLEHNYSVIAVLDDAPRVEFLSGIPVLLPSEVTINEFDTALISIGNNNIRKKIAATFKASFIAVAHPSACISKSATLGTGSVVMANAVVNASAVVGDHCIVNSGAIVEHDCELANFVHVSPNAALAGGVKIGEGSHVGIGASVIQGVTIGKWVTIGAGTVVLKDIPDYAVVVGNPGRIVKYNNPL